MKNPLRRQHQRRQGRLLVVAIDIYIVARVNKTVFCCHLRVQLLLDSDQYITAAVTATLLGRQHRRRHCNTPLVAAVVIIITDVISGTASLTSTPARSSTGAGAAQQLSCALHAMVTADLGYINATAACRPRLQLLELP